MRSIRCRIKTGEKPATSRRAMTWARLSSPTPRPTATVGATASIGCNGQRLLNGISSLARRPGEGPRRLGSKSALELIWRSHVSASRLLQRLERVIDVDTVERERAHQPASWRGPPAQSATGAEEGSEAHRRSAAPCVAVDSRAAAVRRLDADPGLTARPLAFLMLTAAARPKCSTCAGARSTTTR